ncbi:hypothetical protein ACQPYE_28085 [Actinosynnema sp. CA-299493]
MNKGRKAALAATMTGLALGSALIGAGPAAASTDGIVIIQGTCGQSFNPTVGGGAAAWRLTCASGRIRAQGWVSDTDADGKRAEVFGTWGNGDSFGIVKAAGDGNTTSFDKSHAGSTVYLYLRVI